MTSLVCFFFSSEEEEEINESVFCIITQLRDSGINGEDDSYLGREAKTALERARQCKNCPI